MGLAYVTDSDCTFIWEGALDFSRLEEEVLGEIPARISGASTFAPVVQLSYMSHSIEASLILSSGELQELDLDNPMQRLSYKGVTSDPSQIQFVRFDVYGELHGVRSGFSLTAENSELSDDCYGELALQLSSDQVWSTDLIKWIFGHHQASEMLERHIDPKSFTYALSEIGGPWPRPAQEMGLEPEA